MVADIPGLTRDRHYGNGRGATRTLSGGGHRRFRDRLSATASCTKWPGRPHQAVAEADAVIFVVDARGGATPHDKIIANHLRQLEQAGAIWWSTRPKA